MAKQQQGLLKLYEDTRSPATCRGCHAAIVFFKTVANDKFMPMNAGAEPKQITHHDETRRTIGHYSQNDSHFATCPERAQFSKR